MDLLLTRSFLAVVETGSITDAAERLGVTQSALSRRIRQYEEQLHSQLFTRSRKGVELTETGRLAVNAGRRLLTTFENLREEIALHQGLEGGTVKIGGGATAVSFVLPPAIAAFQQDHPKVLFQLKEAGSSEIANDVLNGRLELGIVTLPRQSRELAVQHVTEDDIVLVARKDHPLAQKGSITPHELIDQAFVGFEGGTALRKLIDNEVRNIGVDINVVMELRSIPSILRMVLTTGHLAFVSRMALSDQTDIVEVKVDGLRIRRRLAVVSRRHATLSAAAQAFAQRLAHADDADHQMP